MPRGFPAQDTGPGMNELFHDLTVQQEEDRAKRAWPDPTPEMLASPEFEAIWQCIKRWDINVPGAYTGYCGATGNHVRAILDALKSITLAEKASDGLTQAQPTSRTVHL